jgi:hypothetical protein
MLTCGGVCAFEGFDREDLTYEDLTSLKRFAVNMRFERAGANEPVER